MASIVKKKISDFLLWLTIQTSHRDENRRVYKVKIENEQLIIADGIKSKAAAIVVKEMQRSSYRLDKISFSPQDIVIDIGAHVGIFACYLAKKYPEITLYAFEPTKENFSNLLFNITQNGIKNIKAFNTAISGDGRPLPMMVHACNTGGASSQQQDMNSPDHTVFTIESRTLDSVFKEFAIKKCKLLKIDCEGSEHEVLLNSTCLDRIEHLRGEFHINKFLANKGYSLGRLNDFCKKHIPADNIVIEEITMAE